MNKLKLAEKSIKKGTGQMITEIRGDRSKRGIPNNRLRSLGKEGFIYAKSVLAPFSSDVVRGPSDFY